MLDFARAFDPAVQLAPQGAEAAVGQHRADLQAFEDTAGIKVGDDALEPVVRLGREGVGLGHLAVIIEEGVEQGLAREHVDLAIRLSPLDPLFYGMLGTRAFTHMAVGEDLEAASWAERAARSPGAHVLIAMIAAATQALAGHGPVAESWAKEVRKSLWGPQFAAAQVSDHAS